MNIINAYILNVFDGIFMVFSHTILFTKCNRTLMLNFHDNFTFEQTCTKHIYSSIN